MAVIACTGWGTPVPFDAGYEDSRRVRFCFPIAPACCYWQDGEADGNLRMFGGVRYELDTDVGAGAVDDAYQLRLELFSESIAVSSEMGDEGSVTWKDADVESETGPVMPTEVSPYKTDQVIPYVYGQISAQHTSAAEATDTGYIYGFDVGVEYDNDFDGVTMEVYDYTDNASYGADNAAPSFVASRLLCDGYNKLIFSATWRIGVAVCDDAR